MSQGAVHRELSRRQGLYATSNTAALAVAAGVSDSSSHQLGAPLHVARHYLYAAHADDAVVVAQRDGNITETT